MPLARHILTKRVLRTILGGWLTVALGSTPGLPLILETLSTRDGLPQGNVMATLQDSQGFVWLGTEDGLVRYDGHEVHRYAYSPTVTGGLPGNFIDAIAEDGHGDLWIAIKGSGLAHWHRSTDRFTVYRHDPAHPDTLSSDAVRAILIDRSGLIWVGTMDAGLDILDPATSHFRHLRHLAARADSLADDQIQTMMQDSSGSIWIGTHSGLDQLAPDGSGFLHYSLQTQTTTANHPPVSVSQVVEDGADSLWVGSFEDGLFRIDRHGRLLDHFQHDAARSNSLSDNDVRAILDDHAGHLWVGTPEGLDLLNPASHQFSHYGHRKADPGSLSDSFVMSLYQDSAGLVWIGTRAGGVNRWNPHSWELGGSRPDWLEGKLVTAFAEAPDNHLWIGSEGGGLVQFDAATGQAIDLDSMLKPGNPLGDRRVMSLLEDRDGVLWIGTMAEGLKKLSNGRITSIPVRPGDSQSLSAAGIMTIFEARDRKLWIGTHGGGANILDPATGRIEQLPFASAAAGALSGKNITSFLEDSLGNFWIGTDSGGLNLARPDGSVVRVFKHDPRTPSSLSANTVYSLAMDSHGSIWIGTDGGGLDRVVGSSAAPQSIRFENISSATGLSSDTIYGVLPDSAGHLWLSGNAGLMRFDPATHAVKTYYREHGLQGEEFNFGAYYRTRNGMLCFGGPGGFNVFKPAQLTENLTPPRLALMHVEVLGAPVQSATPYWLMHHIDLNYHANIVSLDFAPLDFTSLNRNQLAYRMAGLTDNWISLGSLRRVTLTNLEAGDHVLEVRAVNADSVWSKTPLRVTLHKDAAPWRSNAAYTCYVLLMLGLIVLGLRAQRLKLRRALAAQQRLESEVALRTYELRETNHQLVVASEAKSSFLARMSHELRTPMNGVVGMAELLARSPLSAAQSRQTQTIRSSAQTLLQILNDLLDLSKLQAGRITLEHLPVDLVQICEECAALFSGAAETKELDLIVSPPPNDQWRLLGDPLRIRQILMNLIGNAVKFTEHGEIVVTCDISAAGNGEAAVRLTVSDTGIGMTEAAMARIFEPFTQGDETTTRRFGGTGLGLSICREFIELMGGTIEVTSVSQVGSTFTVSLSLSMSAAPQSLSDPLLSGVPVKILTRRKAMGESLSRYLSAFAPAAVTEFQDLSTFRCDDTDMVVLDAESYPEVPEMSRPAFRGAPQKLIVIARTDSIEASRLETMVSREKIVRRPVTRDALRDALTSALRGPVPVTTSDEHASPNPRVRKGHVLIVEDEHINAAVAAGYLSELGYTSVWVESGSAAVARTAVERFDLILMDLNMPGLDGYASTELIRKSAASGVRIPIVALTANDPSAYRDTCLLAGMDDILGKPYSLPQCAEMLRHWLPDQQAKSRDISESHSAMATIDSATVAGLRRLKGSGSPDLYAKLVTLFETSSSESLEQLGRSLQIADLSATSTVAHRFKSAAANVGALEFAKVLAELERAGVEKDLHRARQLHDRLAVAHPLLVEQLRILSLRASA